MNFARSVVVIEARYKSLSSTGWRGPRKTNSRHCSERLCFATAGARAVFVEHASRYLNQTTCASNMPFAELHWPQITS